MSILSAKFLESSISKDLFTWEMYFWLSESDALGDSAWVLGDLISLGVVVGEEMTGSLDAEADTLPWASFVWLTDLSFLLSFFSEGVFFIGGLKRQRRIRNDNRRLVPLNGGRCLGRRRIVVGIVRHDEGRQRLTDKIEYYYWDVLGVWIKPSVEYGSSGCWLLRYRNNERKFALRWYNSGFRLMVITGSPVLGGRKDMKNSDWRCSEKR